MTKELEGLEEGLKEETRRFTQNDTKKKISNWKMLGHDGINGFWFKKFSSIHDRLAQEMNRYLQGAHVPEWMTKRKITLIQIKGTAPKQLQTHNLPTNDVENINSTNKGRDLLFTYSRRLFPEEQKGCRKGSRVTGELLYMEKHILNESKTRRKNLAIAWTDYKKAYDMVP